MSSHLGLGDLADLIGAEDPPPADGHLAGCAICQDRLTNLRARSADVSAALGGGQTDVGPMPVDVTERITAALTAARAARPDELAVAREQRSRRLRGWLAAAAAVVVVGAGFGAITHVAGGRTASTNSASTGASDASGGESLTAGAPATANPSAASGVLLDDSFAQDVKAFVAGKGQVKPLQPLTQPLAGSGSNLCATVATTHAAATAGEKALGGNVAAGSATVVGAVTVDGRPGVLYLVDVGPAKVAVAIAGCSSNSLDVLASATLM